MTTTTTASQPTLPAADAPDDQPATHSGRPEVFAAEDLQAAVQADVDYAVALAMAVAEHIEPSSTLPAGFILDAANV